MMGNMYYSPYDISIIIINRNMGIVEESSFLDFLWEYEKEYISKEYRQNQRQFILDVKKYINILGNIDELSSEFPIINRDLSAIGSNTEYGLEVESFEGIDIFFKNLRLRILYLEKQGYVRMKLRTLLGAYGYVRRSKQLKEYINKCLYFYHIETYLRGGEECLIDEIELDDMVVFRRG